MQSSDHERPSMIMQPQSIDFSAVGGLSQHLTPQQAPDFRIIQSITNPAIQELIRPQVQAEPIPEQNMLIERQQNQIEDLNEGPVLLEEHKWPPIDQLEENYKRSLDQKFSENLQSILLDERLAGAKDALIFANDPEIDGFQPDDVRRDNSFHSDSEDDKEVILTEQEQQDLKARKKRIYEAYLLKLQRERDQERARYQDILRQKNLEQKKSQCYEDGEDSSLPLIQMRHDDLLGKSQHIKFDVNGASGAIKFKRESPGNKQVLQVPIRSTKMATKLDMDKFSIDEKVRDVHRRILQQNALIQSNKERHQTFVPHLTDIQEIEEERKDIVEEIKEEKKEERSNYLIEEEKQGSNGPMMIFEESSKQQYISNSQNFQIDQKRPQSKPQEECKQSEISLKLGNLEDQDFSLIDEESVSQTQSQFSPQEEERQIQKAQTESEKEMNLKRLLKDIDKIDLVGLCIPEHLKISLSNVKDQIQKLNQNRYHSSIAINNSYSKFSGLENRQVSGLSDDNIRKKISQRPKQLDGQGSDQLFNFEQEGEIHDKQASESNSLKSSLIEAKTPPQGSINSAEQDKSDQICRPFKSLQEEKLPKLSAEEINRNKFLQEKQRYYLESMKREGLVPAMILEEASSMQSNQNSHLAQSQESCFNDQSAIKSSQSLILVQSDQNAGKIKIRRWPKPSKSDKAVKFFVKDFENTLKIPNKNNSQVIPNIYIEELKEVHQQKNGVGVSNANVDESAAIWHAKQVSALKSPLKEGLYEKRRAAFRITNLPRRQFANLGMLRDHCQKTIGPDSYFIMTQLAEKDVQIQNQGGLTWDKTMIKGKHRRRKNNWEEDQDYTSRSSIKSVEATQEVKKDGQNVEGGQNSAEEVKAAEIKAKA